MPSREAGVRTETVAKGRGFDATLSLRLAIRLSMEGVSVVHSHNPPAR